MATILVIDDDKLMRFTLRSVLEAAGHTVLESDNAKSGMELHANDPADLVITDILMPGSTGIEFVEKLHKTFPTTPVFCISGGLQSDGMDFLKMAKIIGARRTFRKPVDAKALLLAIEEEIGA